MSEFINNELDNGVEDEVIKDEVINEVEDSVIEKIDDEIEEVVDVSKTYTDDEVESMINDRLNDPKFKEDYIRENSKDLINEVESLRVIKDNYDREKTNKDYSENPDKVIQEVRDSVKKTVTDEFNAKLLIVEDELKDALDRLNCMIAKQDEDMINKSISDSLSKYNLVEGASNDISELLRDKFKVKDGVVIGSTETEGVDSIFSIDDFLTQYLKNRQYFLKDKKGSGVYNESNVQSTITSSVLSDNRFLNE